MRTIQAIIFVICLTASSTLWGQVPDKFAQAAGKLVTEKTVARGAADAPDITARLQAQVQRSYKQAMKMQDKYPDVLPLNGPSKSLLPVSAIPWLEKAYPPETLLSNEQLPSYFLIQHNTRLSEWLPILGAREKALSKYKDELKKHLREVDHPAAMDMHWLADRVTDETKYFLIGEKHGHSEITHAVVDWLRLLRAKQPQREIFLFTEFLPEGQVWCSDFPRLTFHPSAFKMAEKMHIPVIGLEPEFAEGGCYFSLECVNALGWQTERNIWMTLEGIRLRNERWMQVIQEYRAKYPDALFIIYGGGGHMNYTAPYSVGRQLAGEHTQVALIYPKTVYTLEGSLTAAVDEFDYVTVLQFPQRVLWWDNPAAAWLSGFDIRIKIPVSHKND